jgi:serine-aspartate repeat-containing protein C/D/E
MGSYPSAPLRASAPRTRHSIVWAASTALLSPWLSAVSVANDAGSTSSAEVNAPTVYTVRLSVLNGGAPRDPELATGQIAQLPADVSDPFLQKLPELDRARFLLRNDDEARSDEPSDGGTPASVTNNVLPIAGDFDGDGDAEFGIFRDGQWFIDLNGNGTWDQDDLWAQLGSAGDQPLVGDWDGDGKADIGVYGPQAATNVPTADSGLPDANNDAQVAKQNQDADAAPIARPVRLLKQGAAGNVRSDAVEFVQDFGNARGIAIAGDFNGDGIDTVALFQDGHWTIDLNGDGQITPADLETNFGQAGDRPFAGDFNGDGSDEIGVYRDGHWAIATGDDAELRVTEFTFGGPNALPVVGDFDGDGRDEAAVYRQ